jgi:hypothetical protein
VGLIFFIAKSTADGCFLLIGSNAADSLVYHAIESSLHLNTRAEMTIGAWLREEIVALQANQTLRRREDPNAGKGKGVTFGTQRGFDSISFLPISSFSVTR